MERRTFLATLATIPFSGLSIDLQALQFPQGSPAPVRTEDDVGNVQWVAQPVGGTFRVSIDGMTTRPLAFDATQADFDRAVEELFPDEEDWRRKLPIIMG
jgi:hypothetical protein